MGGTLTVGSIGGIDIRIHRSWIIIAVLIAWTFYVSYAGDERSVLVTLAMAVAAAVLFFASVLVHELAHSLEAQHRGVHVGGITLFLFGGATETSFDVERPGDEFALTAVGPFSSLVLAGLFGLVATYAGQAGLSPVAELAAPLAYINVALAVFNLLPGAPLDGGRILRAAVWKLTGDRQRAVRVASRSGQVIGGLIAALGLAQILLVPAGLVNGIWFLLIGWFLASAAGSEIVQQKLRQRLGGLTVAELVSAEPLPSVAADTDVAGAAELLRRRPEDALAVDRGDETQAILGIEDVAGVPADRRGAVSAADVATSLDDVPTVPADTELVDAVSLLGKARFLAVVRDDGTVLGIVTRETLQRVVKRSLQLDGVSRASQRRPHEHIPGGDRP